MRLGRTQMRVNPASLSFVVKARICVYQRGDQPKPIRRITHQGYEILTLHRLAKIVDLPKKESLRIYS
jgi:hypothetical protein